MSVFIRALDNWILDKKIQPFAWKMEFYFCLNQFACARIALLLGLAGALFLKGQVWGFLILLGVIGLMWTTFAFEEQISAIAGARNNLRKGFFLLRILFLFLFLATLFTLALSIIGFAHQDLFLPILSFSAFLHCYFIACENMPPAWKDAKDKRLKKARIRSGK